MPRTHMSTSNSEHESLHVSLSTHVHTLIHSRHGLSSFGREGSTVVATETLVSLHADSKDFRCVDNYVYG